jgi:hypothetical protein
MRWITRILKNLLHVIMTVNGGLGVKYRRRNRHSEDYVHTPKWAITIIHVPYKTRHPISS